jgi:formate/nitrite transporter FocA (FNT family)
MTASQHADDDEPDQLTQTLQRTIDEGVFRLNRSLSSLLATGLVGGADVGAGVFALLIVLTETHSVLLSALAFSIGFIMLTLASSELFTENYLVPIAAVIARKARVPSVFRLWGGTLVTNLLGGWLLVGLVTSAFPRLEPAALEVAQHYVDIGIGWRSFAGALLGGSLITLMTWMERSTESVPAKLVAAVITAFLLAAGPLNHVIVVSLEMFTALQYGAPFGYLDWLGIAAWYTLGNVIGGVLLVTGLRVVQIGPERISEERERPVSPPSGDDTTE